jgi:hypothetical protein
MIYSPIWGGGKLRASRFDCATGELKTKFVLDNATSGFQPLYGAEGQGASWSFPTSRAMCQELSLLPMLATQNYQGTSDLARRHRPAEFWRSLISLNRWDSTTWSLRASADGLITWRIRDSSCCKFSRNHRHVPRSPRPKSLSPRKYTHKAYLFNWLLPVNNSLIDYPVKRYDRAFELASDVINENFTARNFRGSLLGIITLAVNKKY